MKSRKEIEEYLGLHGYPAFRAKQILQAVYKEGANDISQIAVLPKAMRKELALEMPVFCFKKVHEVSSKSGDTVKSLFKLYDGALVEGVLMRFRDGRNSVCISSQVGCGLKCTFCATGTMGFTRNLSIEEIADQVLYFDQFLKNDAKNDASARRSELINKDARGEAKNLALPVLSRESYIKEGEATGRARGEAKNLALPVLSRESYINRVSHVIFMGMGEPFLNYDAVIGAIESLNDPECLGLAARHITVSTSGIVPSIKKFADFPIQANLAISIHAPNQELRESLMPIARAYKLDQLIDAINFYIEKTNRRVSYEYVMLKEKNDTPELAEQLAKLIRGQRAHVNLIPYNETYLGFSNAGKSRIDRFREVLESFDIPVTVRVSLGQDISAACGQLAGYEGEGKK